MTSRKAQGESSVISADEWRALALLQGDFLAVVDPTRTCVEPDAIKGRPIGESFAADDAPALDALLVDRAVGPLWLRHHSGGEQHWLHVTAVPRSGGGWVVQGRAPRHVHAPAADQRLDSVTGLISRDRALDEVAFLLSATPRTGKEIAVACFDLDNFHDVAERYGWSAGDEVLRVVAGRVSDALRSGDLVARLEKDTFLVVLRGVHHLRGAIRVANKVRVSVDEEPIPLAGGEATQTISIGVTLLNQGESLDSVLNRAAGAMDMARSAGGNTVVSSPPI